MDHCFNILSNFDAERRSVIYRLKADGPCSHGVAMLLLHEQWKMAGYTEEPAMLSCTSLPQQCDKPRGEKVTAEPVATMIIAKPSNTTRKRKPVMATFSDNRYC